jgi:hypothetical protein
MCRFLNSHSEKFRNSPPPHLPECCGIQLYKLLLFLVMEVCYTQKWLVPWICNFKLRKTNIFRKMDVFFAFKWKSSNLYTPLGRIELSWINGPVMSPWRLRVSKSDAHPLYCLQCALCASNHTDSHIRRWGLGPVRPCVQTMDSCPTRLSVSASRNFVIRRVMLQRLRTSGTVWRTVGEGREGGR